MVGVGVSALDLVPKKAAGTAGLQDYLDIWVEKY